MERWEYKRFTSSAHGDALVRVLDQYGLDGWELVHVTPGEHEVTVYMKRVKWGGW